MKFHETDVHGAYRIELDRRQDDRGYFARLWCQREFEQFDLSPLFVQMNKGVSAKRGTVRGMHFQRGDGAEIKLVRCPRGALFDVCLDLRPSSPTYLKWAGVELTAENGTLLYIPQGCAHGYQTLADDTEMDYMTSQFYMPELADGVRYNDRAFAIRWPLPPAAISDADAGWPDFTPQT